MKKTITDNKKQSISNKDRSFTEGDEIKLLKNQLARVLADYDNLKKRSDEERMSMYKFISISYVSRVLPILDSLREAQNHLNDTGIAIIIGQIETLLKEDGFTEIVPKVGEVFDETTCEAVETVETKEKEDNNNISKLVLSGWKYDNSVVRFAKVEVYKFKLEGK